MTSMDRRTFLATGSSGLVSAGAGKSFPSDAHADGAIHVLNGVPNGRVKEAVFFPFDRKSVPFSHGLRIHLISAKQPGKSTQIVMGRGSAGQPDDLTVRFYGTVIPSGDELRMWYMAHGSAMSGSAYSIGYATSKDGKNWVKPDLGLVDYNGSKSNNLVNFRGGKPSVLLMPIILDPDDPNPARRYKMVFECPAYDFKVAVAFSPDGLNWTESPKNPVVNRALEPTGLIKFNGCYYVTGQGGWHYGPDRKIVTHASYDFDLWTEATCLSFQRNTPPPVMDAEWNTCEEAHIGTGMWDRGNVILGVYDMWHGPKSSDRGSVVMDLGLLVSHDALEFHEPIANFRLVPAYEEFMVINGVPMFPQPPLGHANAVSHGQGMCNWGDQTLLFYELWGLGDVRLASWPRDRIGCFHPLRTDSFTMHPVEGPSGRYHCITCPVEAHRADARVYINADGFSPHSELRVELLDLQFRPIAGYSGNTVVPVREGGLRTPVRWSGIDAVGQISDPFRIRATWDGVRAGTLCNLCRVNCREKPEPTASQNELRYKVCLQ